MVDIPREALQSIHGDGDGDEPKADFEQLCRDLEQVDDTLPDGYRVEIIGGGEDHHVAVVPGPLPARHAES
ncbi:hypothetical protein [Streptomyces mobaraensis]|uniref:hypothetical protein n=1 Tax=Streptomyces mobaraensis TaxID=35621 RepID=UPI0033EC9CC5